MSTYGFKMDGRLSSRSKEKSSNLEIFPAIFLQIINIETSLEKSRLELAQREDFNVKFLFENLDLKSKGKISFNHFYNFLQEDLQLKNLNINQVEELFGIYDLDQDNFLNICEFTQIMAPRKYELSYFLNANSGIKKLKNLNFSKVNFSNKQ